MILRKFNRENRNVLNRAERWNTSGIRPTAPMFQFDGGTITKREHNQSWHYDNCYGGIGMTSRASGRLRNRTRANKQMIREFTF